MEHLGDIKQKMDEAVEEKKVHPPQKKVPLKLVVKNVEIVEASDVDGSGF